MLFVPRQVALAAAASTSSSQPRAAAAGMAKEEPKKEKKSKNKSKAAAKETPAAAAAAPDARAAVVASVAAFLEAGGFPRALTALQSEADLEAGAWRSSPVNLEELVAKFLESSNPTPVDVAVGSDEQDKTTDGVAKDGGKKKKEKKTGVEAGESEKKESEPSAQEKPSENAGGEAKEKKQKKKKKDDSSAVNTVSDEATQTAKNDDQKPDGKKKKSKKQEKDDDVEARLEKAELAIKNKFEAAEKLNGDGDETREEEQKSQNDDADKNSGAIEKKKKKKKDKSATETSEKTDTGAVPAETAVETVKDDKEKKAKKKRKKSDSEENVQVEGKEVAGKDSVPKPDAENKSAMVIEEGDNGKLSNENGAAGKKRKLEDDTANQSLTNGFPEDKTNQDGNIKPTKRQKTSEPKTVNAFQRVKLEDIKFADERLQDNSYWSKGGAETGYGAKAQEILGQVRGRGFRHEKTKKKRGSYRGGQIDLQTHSIKFDNSDDE